MSLTAHVSGHDRRTLDQIFSHPISNNVHWKDVMHLISTLGSVQEEHNGKFLFQVGELQNHFHMPHTKELTAPELLAIRAFLKKAGISAEEVEASRTPAHGATEAAPEAATVISIDHHDARIYALDGTSADEHTLRPYDPHHFLHHLTHKNQDYKGQRAPEDDSFYEHIAKAIAATPRILIVSHGVGESNAGEALEHWLKHKHSEIYARVVKRINANTSALSEAELLAIAKRELA